MGRSEHTLHTNDVVRTPARVLDPIYEHFGPIGLDPYAHPRGIVVAQNYFFLPEYMPEVPDDLPGIAYATDGHKECWDGFGLVFANGPWSELRDDRAHTSWAEKGGKEGDEVILLVPCRTGSEWWQRYVAPADVILFWRGRMKFHEERDAAPFHVALVYWGPRPELMPKAFGERHWRVENRGVL